MSNARSNKWSLTSQKQSFSTSIGRFGGSQASVSNVADWSICSECSNGLRVDLMGEIEFARSSTLTGTFLNFKGFLLPKAISLISSGVDKSQPSHTKNVLFAAFG